MSYERIAPEVRVAGRFQSEDDRAPLALAAGLVAALVAGGLWAVLVLVTNYEIGYAAWGVGVLVGVAMARATQQRSKQLATLAALFAVIGLLAGKAFILMGSAGPLARELEDNSENLTGAVAWSMYDERTLDEGTLAKVDATLQAGDTLSDALWASMTQQATTKLRQMNEDQRHAAAVTAARTYLGNVGWVQGIKNQLSLFDLLWLFLAVGTAYKLMAERDEVAPQVEVNQPA